MKLASTLAHPRPFRSHVSNCSAETFCYWRYALSSAAFERNTLAACRSLPWCTPSPDHFHFKMEMYFEPLHKLPAGSVFRWQTGLLLLRSSGITLFCWCVVSKTNAIKTNQRKILILWISYRELSLIDCQKIILLQWVLSNDMHTQVHGKSQTFCIICGGKIAIQNQQIYCLL